MKPDNSTLADRFAAARQTEQRAAYAAQAAKLEEITKALHGAAMLGCDLQAALRHAGPVEALALYPLIAQARALADGIGALDSALRATE